MLQWTLGCMYPFRSCFFFSRYMPRSGIAGSYGSSILNFLRKLHTFLMVTVPIYIPTKSIGGFPSLHTLLSICCGWIFLMITILTCVRWYPIVVFICISLITRDVEHFSCAYWPSVCPLWRNVGSDLLPIFEWVVCSEAVKHHKVFVNFWD